MKIDLTLIRAELQELADSQQTFSDDGGKRVSIGTVEVTIKLDRHLSTRIKTRETDKGYQFTLNPTAIRSQSQLEACFNECRLAIVG